MMYAVHALMIAMVAGSSRCCIGQTPELTVSRAESHLIGKEEMKIEASDKIIKATISKPAQSRGIPGEVLVVIRLANMTGSEIASNDIGVAFEVRYKNTGALLSETSFGCSGHFFSDCHTSAVRSPKIAPPEWHIPSNASVVIGTRDLRLEYNFVPGDFVAVGYVCHQRKHQGPDCFKTNRLVVTFP